MRILIIEDDRTVAAGLREGLERSGASVDHVRTAEDADMVLQTTAYDLAIVDLGLPDMDGKELIRRIRQHKVDIPLLVLTARDQLEERVSCLDFGADDFMVKPFQLAELQARARALIRRSRYATSAKLVAGDLTVDLSRHEVESRGEVIALTSREWDILERLVLAMPNVLAKKKLVESLSSWDNELTPNAIELYVSRLRGKIAGRGIEIRTIRGIGYRLDEV